MIIVGLYLVVWGKNKDGNGSSEDLKLPTKQTQEIEASNSIDINNDPK